MGEEHDFPPFQFICPTGEIFQMGLGKPRGLGTEPSRCERRVETSEEGYCYCFFLPRNIFCEVGGILAHLQLLWISDLI